MEEFVVGFRRNQNFNHLAAIYFTAEGGGAALLLAAFFIGNSRALMVGLAMVLAGVAALMLDLGKPSRFWRSVYKPGRSWISRGAIFVGALIALSGLYMMIPGAGDIPAGRILRLLAALLCLPTILYTGFLLDSFKGAPSWNNRRMPELFCLHSAATGLSVGGFVLGPALGAGWASSLSLLQVLVLASALALTGRYYRTVSRGGPAEQESARILAKGEMRRFFIHGAVLAGLAVPLVMALASYFGAGAGFWNSAGVLAVSALVRVGGDFCFRYSILKSGVYEPVLA